MPYFIDIDLSIKFAMVLLGLVLLAITLQFLRNPKRIIPNDSESIVSVADGRVISVSELKDEVSPIGEPAMVIAVFMSPFNAHVNRVPIEGQVIYVEHKAGTYLEAFKLEAGTLNEQTKIVIEKPGYKVAFKQISGFVARRIVCNLKIGEKVRKGQKFGATGFIGGNLAIKLLAEGSQVRVLLRKNSATENLNGIGVKKFYGDYENVESLREAVEDVDYIFHCAGAIKSATGSLGYYKGNVVSTMGLLYAVAFDSKRIQRFVYVSSLSASGPAISLDRALTEEATCKPISLYGMSKHDGEVAVRMMADRVPFTIIRPSVVFGERDLEMLKPFQAIANGLLPVLGIKREKYLSFIYVQDLIDGMISAATSISALNQTYYLTDPTPYSYRQFCEIIRKKLNKKFVLSFSLPEWSMYLPAFFVELGMKLTGKASILSFDKAKEMKQDYWICSAEKAKRELGFQIKVSLEDAIEKTIVWAKLNKLL
ncbi:hypothetical protein CHS0354_024141 [Potamilus streckersoni]|uniref:Thioester reductase (TE) domain-containing protein n=1 Tax=Potamilus streckersoni TaxID=2493646 RepID=A0AAE0VMS3_9BIVA|nr:hypothetical protein CHS0354_024141 [Potamilus streckersoni]